MPAINVLDSGYDPLFYTLNAVELILIFASIVLFSTIVYVVTETPLLHVNYMRLFKSLYIEFCIFSLARIINLVSVQARVVEASKINFGTTAL